MLLVGVDTAGLLRVSSTAARWGPITGIGNWFCLGSFAGLGTELCGRAAFKRTPVAREKTRAFRKLGGTESVEGFFGSTVLMEGPGPKRLYLTGLTRVLWTGAQRFPGLYAKKFSIGTPPFFLIRGLQRFPKPTETQLFLPGGPEKKKPKKGPKI